MSDKEKFSPEKLQEIRHKYNLSQNQLAKVFQCSKFNICQWEIGRRHPSKNGITLYKILEKYGPELFEQLD